MRGPILVTGAAGLIGGRLSGLACSGRRGSRRHRCAVRSGARRSLGDGRPRRSFRPDRADARRAHSRRGPRRGDLGADGCGGRSPPGDVRQRRRRSTSPRRRCALASNASSRCRRLACMALRRPSILCAKTRRSTRRMLMARARSPPRRFFAPDRHDHGLPVIALRPSSVYGPGRMISCFIRDMIDHARRGVPLALASEGACRRQFVHVDDVVAAILGALSAASPRPFRVQCQRRNLAQRARGRGAGDACASRLADRVSRRASSLSRWRDGAARHGSRAGRLRFLTVHSPQGRRRCSCRRPSSERERVRLGWQALCLTRRGLCAH